ncbi:uncharacterized protein LOC121246100 [Juglans microcarpa x Juglans regia]|uniref:uncharacterized protein LOC121246100 n=1 Tax=Juglans microcarpa x Juglans regia TaxID=2249226 RepID=UPI001B7E012A|nr:uncharacterized protein LOC121246100 [Juglans microcarpa x Juglans regia]
MRHDESMASSSSLDSSNLNSTSGLLSLLDLNLQQDQNMEEMDIDQVVDVPDTPDRLAAHCGFGKNCMELERNVSSAVDLRTPDFVDEKCMNGLRGRNRLFNDKGQNGKLVIRSRKSIRNDESKGSNNSIVHSPSENPYAPRNACILRRPAKDESYNHKTRHSIGAENMDKEKDARFMLPSKSSSCQEDTLSFISGSSKASSNAYKGKEKLEDDTFKVPGLALALGKGANMSIDSQHETVKQMPVPVSSLTLPRFSGQKRLVRNGCISPLNIATRAKQLAERQSTSSTVEQSHLGAMVSKSPPCLTNIRDIVSEDNSGNRVKGKGVSIHPSASKEQGANIVCTTGSPVINNEEADGSSYVSGDPFGCSEELRGWRSTRNRSKKTGHPLSERAGCLSGVESFVTQQHENRVERRDVGSGINHRAQFDFVKDHDAAETASKIVSEADRIAGPHRAANTLIRRQKKHKLTSRNAGECSTSVSNDSDIVFLGSSWESFNSRSIRDRNRQPQGSLHQVIEVDELSPEMTQPISRGLECMDNDDSDARARQLEADELLARELQEQLYQEVPVVGGGEIDENLAWVLQQEDVFDGSSGGSHNESHLRGSLASHAHRQPVSRFSQNPLTRRGTQARAPTSRRIAQSMGAQVRVPTSSRIARLRNRFSRHSPALSSNGRNLRFPLDMDLDMRLDILEALETAVGHLSDGSTANSILQVQRDFNENDYEMLLALDDNNHQHGGASVSQINCLPQSTVRTDASEEACAICLEVPTTGETIRHLPCLHKFHKDCIDPWLSRKTSCPVCKSSIT